MPSITEDKARSEYIAGLRALADLLETTPELPLPDTGRAKFAHSAFSLCGVERSDILPWAKVLTGVEEHTREGIHYVTGDVHGIRFRIFGDAGRLGGDARTVTKHVTEYSVPSLLAEATQ